MLPSSCRTWAEEMGIRSCGPGAHPVHLWPPHFAFSDHHPWDLGAHSGPALVRIAGGGGRGGPAAGGSDLFPLWVLLVPASLSGCLSLISDSLCHLLFFFLFCLFLGLVPVCLSWSLTHRSCIQERRGGCPAVGPAAILIRILSLSLLPSPRKNEDCRASP